MSTDPRYEMSTDPRYETSTDPRTEMSTQPGTAMRSVAPADGPRTAGEGLPARDGAESDATDTAGAGAGAAATFDTHCTMRLPNTVDRENEHVG